MKVLEAIDSLNEICNQRVEISGYMSVTPLFSYMYEEPEREEDFQTIKKYILVADQRIMQYLDEQHAPSLTGSEVCYQGKTTLVANISITHGYPMFAAMAYSVSEMSFETFGYYKFFIFTRFFEPPRSIYLPGGRKYSNEQIKIIKRLKGGSENFIELRNKLLSTGKHLLDKGLTPTRLNEIVNELEQIAIKDYYIDYTGNNID